MNSAIGYRLSSHGAMITDEPRMRAYAAALRNAVSPGCVVVDIGAGTGIFSLLACQLGAAHVHAIEPDNVVQVAKAIARENGYSDRITFYESLSKDVVIQGQADVIISDLRGVLPLFQSHIPVILDARRRFLAPGGRLIPLRDTIWAALVEDRNAYRHFVEPWLENDFALDLSPGRILVVNTWRKIRTGAESILSTPKRWTILDYQDVDTPDVDGELEWIMDRRGTAHGVVLWFDAELAHGIGFSNAPGEPELIYGSAFFPLENPVVLDEGDEVRVRLGATLTGSDYLWRWTTTVQRRRGSLARPVVYRQSTFFGVPLDPAKVLRRESQHVPGAGRQIDVDRYILSLFDGQATIGSIARRAAERFPESFPDVKAALTRVADLAERYR